MKVLVTVGSKHGSSDEIGAAVRAAIADAGVDAVQLPPEQVTTLAGYDAVVVGSGVYAGRWVDAAKKFVEGHLDELRARPVWVFSSGPLGEPPKPDEEPPDGTSVAERIGAREHRIFAGSLDRAKLGFGERAIIGMVKAPYGDFRSWPTIEAWGTGIARTLLS
jgi:menaquinone-dependent protoporphyrinogen oxidase